MILLQATQPCRWTAADVVTVIGAIATVLIPALVLLIREIGKVRDVARAAKSAADCADVKATVAQQTASILQQQNVQQASQIADINKQLPPTPPVIVVKTDLTDPEQK